MQNRLGNEVEPNRLQPSGVPAASTGQPGWSGRKRIAWLAGCFLAMVAFVGVAAVGGAPVAPAPSPSAGLPSFMTEGFPHEDPALELRMPESVGDLRLKVWSVRGEHILQVAADSALPAVVALLDHSIDDASMAVAGRSTGSEPPNWTFAYRVEGITGQALTDAFHAVNAPPPAETRTVDGRPVRIMGGENGDAVGIEYASADAYFLVAAPDLSSALAMLRQIGQGSGQ
jgi:hypothetical protein